MTLPTLARHCLVPLFALAIAATTASANPHHTERIARARELPLGTTITVRGTVTVPSNAFDAGFAVQQAHAGIYVLDSLGASRAIGDDIEITGTLVDSFGLLAIQPTSITAHGHDDPVQPRQRRTRKIGEATEGELLELEGRMVGDLFDDSPFGFILHIDDGSGPAQIFLFPGSGIPTAGLQTGVKLHVVCFSNQFETTFECDPRSPDDFTIE
jgi:hypothetical protein